VVHHTYVIPLGDWEAGEDLFIAAHGVVEELGASAYDFGMLLPPMVTMQVSYPGTAFGAPSYFDVTISGGTLLDGTYDDYCVDSERGIDRDFPYMANVYSSYETLPPGVVDYPENLDLVNWIINQDSPAAVRLRRQLHVR
jgi:hypothetical protein